jgi:ElaB/YqjD/DUF883 family membrane-anchored ribosome-binding protein
MKIENAIDEKLKEKIRKHLSRGKEKLEWLENQVNDEKNHKKLKVKWEDAKEKIADLKETFDRFEKKAVDYTEKNPKKALAIASVAGILAASLWSSFQQKKTSPSPQSAVKTKKISLKLAPKTRKKPVVSKS